MAQELTSEQLDAITHANLNLQRVGLPTYDDLLNLAQRVAEGIPRNTVANIDRARKLLGIDQ